MPSWLAPNPGRPCDRCKRLRVMYALTAHFRWKNFHKENVTKSLSKLTEDKGIALPMARNNIIAFLRPCTRRPRQIRNCTSPLYLAQHSVPCLIEYIHQDIDTIIQDGAVIVRIQISRKLPSAATSLARSISHGNECRDTGTPRGRCGSLCVCDLSVRGT